MTSFQKVNDADALKIFMDKIEVLKKELPEIRDKDVEDVLHNKNKPN